MLQDWDEALVGNNPGAVSRFAPRAPLGRVIIRAFIGRVSRARRLAELPSAA